MKLNLGCGTHYAEGWVNLDATEREGVIPDRIVDPADPFATFDPASADAVYLGHVLEHIPWAAIPRALAQVRAVLRAGGEVLVVGPDVWRTVNRWKAGQEPRSILEAVLEGDHDYLPAEDPGTHKWNCHEARVVGALERAGFVNVHAVRGDYLGGWPVVGWADWQCAVFAVNP